MRDLRSWGRFPAATQKRTRLHDRDAPVFWPDGQCLPRGRGRSYGDSCLIDGGTLLDCTGLDRFIAFDRTSGRLRCEAGIRLREILDLVEPAGWFLPVVPGTLDVTVGGALANDVHGKNHRVRGSFGHHVRRFELRRSDGSVRVCTPDDDGGWFRATVGGLGLTGLVTWVELQLVAVPGPWMEVRSRRFVGLDEALHTFREFAEGSEYRVAWIDLPKRRRHAVRGVVFGANHVSHPASIGLLRRPVSVPDIMPFAAVTAATIGALNAVKFFLHGAAERRTRVPTRRHLFPLDGLVNWNHLYGPRGFLQHQCVLPPTADFALDDLLDIMVEPSPAASLIVLKAFGDRASAGLLSFPREGWTLAADFPMRGVDTLSRLDRLDEVVRACGGAIYPAKDARMSRETFAMGYPQLNDFLPFVDPRLASGLWKRVRP